MKLLNSLLFAAAVAACSSTSPSAPRTPTTAQIRAISESVATGAKPDRGTDEIATLRKGGRASLDKLFARFDLLPAGAERTALAATIDAVAAQRYATVSRLYWHTELAGAQAEARATGRPILSLRMLGRLDEDLSCANSRFFRTILYPDPGIAKVLRERFVLHWSSERPVPQVTIDFGDGRKIQRTTTGNSAHYVLDESGAVIDVLPGVYAPAVFQAELTKSLALAKKLRGLDDARRTAATADLAKQGRDAATLAFGKVAGRVYTPGSRRLAGPADQASDLEKAQRATMSKRIMEVPDLTRIGFDAGAIPSTDIAQWATAGQLAFGLAPARILDAQSRALVARLHDGTGPAAPQAEVDAMIARLEQAIAADTALNELQLRQIIRAHLATTRTRDLATINAWVYANVFHTPKSDAWLGLNPRTDFTGLPGDGVSAPAI
jgi:hypothetical protein